MMDFREFKLKYEKKEVHELNNYALSDNPLVSVIVLTYQHKNYIEKCLKGILSQKTDFKFEIIVGDDESNDGTREICIKYAEEYPDIFRLVLHHRENNMIINNHPTGRFNLLYNLFLARGEYIAFCEGDDFWIDENKLQSQVKMLESDRNISMVVHDAYELINGQKENIMNIKDHEFKFIDPELIIQRKIRLPSLSYVFRKEYLMNHIDILLTSNVGDRVIDIVMIKYGYIGYINKVLGIKNTLVTGRLGAFKKQKYLSNFYKFNTNLSLYFILNGKNKKVMKNYLNMLLFELIKLKPLNFKNVFIYIKSKVFNVDFNKVNL
ncbi:glycosyltransferase family 2 protein [Marinigracilibium pacificum]|uniref:Glycosyltransferase n=1 Tax=Marinigracilibium pacificum TaxID=2729599 RepID=A0A848IUN3_9BACT|nr:glycosyltransferase [Marinigracilibium pacificum]NMM48047.1 glycosyltransferase [Marinigracilibium pacificum]